MMNKDEAIIQAINHKWRITENWYWDFNWGDVVMPEPDIRYKTIQLMPDEQAYKTFMATDLLRMFEHYPKEMLEHLVEIHNQHIDNKNNE